MSRFLPRDSFCSEDSLLEDARSAAKRDLKHGLKSSDSKERLLAIRAATLLSD